MPDRDTPDTWNDRLQRFSSKTKASLESGYKNTSAWVVKNISLRVVLIVLTIISTTVIAVLIVQFITAPETPRRPVKNPLLDPEVQWYLLLGALAVLSVFFFLLMYNIGKITLSSQSLAHRRNVLIAACVLILTLMFPLDIAETLGLRLTSPAKVSASVCTTKCAGATLDSLECQTACAAKADAERTGSETETQLNPKKYIYGILAFFLLYSFVEYFFTFASDYLKSVAEWDTKEIKLGAFGKGSLLLIGAYRMLFDILLPLFAAVYVSVFFHKQALSFLERARDAVTCNSPETPTFMREYQAEADRLLEVSERECPTCTQTRARIIQQTESAKLAITSVIASSPEACKAYHESLKDKK